MKKSLPKFRWVLISLLFAVCVINYIDRSSIAYAITPMGHLFHMDSTQIGLVLGAFGAGYFISPTIGGILVDRYGARRVLTVSVLLWAVSMVFNALAASFLMAFLSRVALGLAEGPNFPAIVRIVGNWLPRQERTRAMGYSFAALPLAIAIGAPLVSQLIHHISWRAMFFVLAGLTLIWIPLWLILFREHPEDCKRLKTNELEHIRANSTRKQGHVKGVWRFILHCPTILANYVAFFAFGYIMFFFMTWLPRYLEQTYHMQLTTVGLFAMLPWLVAAFSTAAVARLSDRIYQKTRCYRKAHSYPILVSQILSALCVLPMLFVHSAGSAILWITLAVGFGMSANADYAATLTDVGKERSATLVGVMDGVFALSGFLAPVLTGWTVQVTGNYHSAFVLLMVVTLVSALVVWRYHHPERERRLVEAKAAAQGKTTSALQDEEEDDEVVLV